MAVETAIAELLMVLKEAIGHEKYKIKMWSRFIAALEEVRAWQIQEAKEKVTLQERVAGDAAPHVWHTNPTSPSSYITPQAPHFTPVMSTPPNPFLYAISTQGPCTQETIQITHENTANGLCIYTQACINWHKKWQDDPNPGVQNPYLNMSRGTPYEENGACDCCSKPGHISWECRSDKHVPTQEQECYQAYWRVILANRQAATSWTPTAQG